MTRQSCNHDFDPTVHAECPECGRPANPAGASGAQAAAPGDSRTDDEDGEVIDINAREPNGPARKLRVAPAREPAFDDDAALTQLTEELDRFPGTPTFVVIGDTSVGKTFYVTMIMHLAKHRGYNWAHVEIDPAGDGTTRPDRVRREDWRTRKVTIHRFYKADEADSDFTSFRVIDMPGEFVAEAMKNQFKGRVSSRERMIFPCLAASQGIVLLIPAPYVFDKARSFEATRAVDDAIELAVGVRLICNLLDDAGGARVEQAMAAFLNLTQEERALRVSEDKRPCDKPFMTLLAQADLLFGPGREGRAIPADGEWPREDDPMGSAAQEIPALINGLANAFAVFRVDYLTAAEGFDNNFQSIDDLSWRTPNLGVWSSVSWMLSQIEGGGRKSGQHRAITGFGAVGSWAASALRWILKGHFREGDARDDRWIIAARKRHDPDFNLALNPDSAEDA